MTQRHVKDESRVMGFTRCPGPTPPTLHTWHASSSVSRPRLCAGVERLFSKDSMHHEFKGAMEDGSLEHSLIACANTE